MGQNAFYWGVIIPAYCETTGNTPKQQDRIFEDLFCPRQVLKHRGREIVVPYHCKDLTPGEFQEVIERIKADAAESGIKIPEGDYERLNM